MPAPRIPSAVTVLLFCIICVGCERSLPQAERTLLPAEAAVLEVAEAALEAITDDDPIALTDLMVPEAIMFPTSIQDGVAGYVARTREGQRTSPWNVDVDERGFDAEVRVSGTVGMVWLPYDLYVDGEWSHCGADIFTMVRSGDEWKIASMAWSTEQPPACREHPDGAPNK